MLTYPFSPPEVNECGVLVSLGETPGHRDPPRSRPALIVSSHPGHRPGRQASWLPLGRAPQCGSSVYWHERWVCRPPELLQGSSEVRPRGSLGNYFLTLCLPMPACEIQRSPAVTLLVTIFQQERVWVGNGVSLGANKR